MKNPNGPGYGWPDKKGNVWVPSGPDGHGCPHWDVQYPDGTYDNIVPGGRIRRLKMKTMDKNNNILVCTAVKFYCLKDEDAFFEWIKKIDCIDKTSASGRELYLHIAADDIHEYDLRDLIGLFYRYNIEMTQLTRFLTDENKKWFYENKKAFWHKKVFKE